MNDTFFPKLNRALRWFLPKEEAQEVLADFQDMRRQAVETGAVFSLAEEKPWSVARSLRSSQEYNRWLLIFGLLLLCPLVPVLYFLTNDFVHLLSWSVPARQTTLTFWPSLALSLYWAHRHKTRRQAPPRSLRLLGGTLALALFNALGSGSVCYFAYMVILAPERWATGRTGWLVVSCVWFFCAVNVLVCAVGLINCRLQSYRWLGLYVLGVTMLACAMLFTDYLRSTALEYDHLHLLFGTMESCLPYWLAGLAVSLKIQL